jgi:hypothetical protein
MIAKRMLIPFLSLRLDFERYAGSRGPGSARRKSKLQL